MRQFLMIAGLFLSLSSVCFARPVSYPDGWTLMVQNNDIRSSVHVHYTPTLQYSMGYRFENWKDKGFSSHLVQRNHLLKRWNRSHSQANLYLKTGLGVSTLEDSGADSKLSGVVSFAGDWETRRYFTSFASRYTEPSVLKGFFRQSARIGWAPYIGDYGDLHSWLMLQIDYRPELDSTLRRTLLLRLFKGVQLLEIGINDAEQLSLNYILRL